MATVAPRKAKLTGPFWDPRNEDAIRGLFLGTAKAEGSSIERDVRRAAPVAAKDRKGAPAGQLRDSLKVRVTASKKKITIAVVSKATNAAGFPYGWAQNVKGPAAGFIDDTLEAHAGSAMKKLEATAANFCEQVNAGVLPASVTIPSFGG